MARKLVLATILAVIPAALLMVVTPRSAPTPSSPGIEVRRLPPLEVDRSVRPVSFEGAAGSAEDGGQGGDEVIRALVAEVSSHPELTAWMASEGLLERFVSAVNSVAGGISPRDELSPLRPAGSFLVEARGDRRVVGPGSFRRYDLAAEVVASIDTPGAVELYRRLLPQLESVHRRVAWQAMPFAAVLEVALDELLTVPIPDGELAVEPRTLTWAWADPELEALSDAQRHLLRMGPRNARRVQAKLREIRSALTRISHQESAVAPDGPQSAALPQASLDATYRQYASRARPAKAPHLTPFRAPRDNPL